MQRMIVGPLFDHVEEFDIEKDLKNPFLWEKFELEKSKFNSIELWLYFDHSGKPSRKVVIADAKTVAHFKMAHVIKQEEIANQAC
ncbi:hypothetical protein IPF37_04270 [bacterium]|nr:MAG: hypothetical protein IPF37_04270 [bacterium]